MGRWVRVVAKGLLQEGEQNRDDDACLERLTHADEED